MRILFVHQNFPAQFLHLAPTLASNPANEVVALTLNVNAKSPGVRIVRYTVKHASTKGLHPWVADFESKVLRGEGIFHAALGLQSCGFTPDVIVAHPGWGEALFLKDVWPSARLGIYSEFYYHLNGFDSDFDPEFSKPTVLDAPRMRTKNLSQQAQFQVADAGLSPTHWQRSVYPEPFRSKISVIHDGIQTDRVQPNPNAWLTAGPMHLTRDDEIITFVNRNLEPYRGYHIFMRALPAILKARPRARVLIVGADGVSYGASAPNGQKWKDIFLNEVRDQLDMSRVHFLGQVPYQYFVPLLQISTVHVYFTYPFVLSWSLLEAMSAGCAVVASNTQPLREAIVQGETGRLVEFFDVEAWSHEVIRLLNAPDERAHLSRNARRFACENYDLQTVCLPAQLAWVNQLAG